MAVMGLALAHAFARGDLAAEGAALVSSPWGLATLTEAYVGFALFGAWIVAREPSAGVATVWIAGLMLGGNVVAGAYVTLAAARCRGDRARFWMGAHGIDQPRV